MAQQRERVDLSQLGFEIRVPKGSNQSLSQSQDEEDQAGYLRHHRNNAPLVCQSCNDKPVSVGGPIRLQDEDGQYDIMPDDVSGVSYYSDDNSSYDEDFTDDEDEDDDDDYRPRARVNRKPMPTRTFPKRTHSGRRQRSNDGLTKADLGYEDLGYEAAATTPSPSQLGYGDDDDNDGCNDEGNNSHPSLGCGYGVGNEETASVSSIRLLSVGKPVNNRRSMGMARRLTGNSARPRRCSSISASTYSNGSSYGGGGSKTGGGKIRHAHSKTRRQSHRDKLVSRTTNRRMSRQHPSQQPVGMMKGVNQISADQQILQDLGCSELFLDPSRRMPKRVSLEFGPGDCNDSITAPKCISMEFDQNSQHGSRVPRKVSISFDQRSTTNNNEQCRRRGSLDFSVGTSQLPRRGSIGRGSNHSLASSTRGGGGAVSPPPAPFGTCSSQQRRGSLSPPPPFGTCRRGSLSPPPPFGTSCRQQQRRGSLDFSVGTSQLPRGSDHSLASSTARGGTPSPPPPCGACGRTTKRRETMDMGSAARQNSSSSHTATSHRGSVNVESALTLRSDAVRSTLQNCRRRSMDLGGGGGSDARNRSPQPPSARYGYANTNSSKLPSLSPPQFKRAQSCGTRPMQRFTTMTPQEQSQSFPPAAGRRVSMGHQSTAGTGSSNSNTSNRLPTLGPPKFTRAQSCGTRPSHATAMTTQSIPSGSQRRGSMGHKRSTAASGRKSKSKSPTPSFPRRTSSIGDLPSPSTPILSAPQFRRAVSYGEGTPIPSRRSSSPLRDGSGGAINESSSSKRRIAPIPRKQFRSSSTSITGTLQQESQQQQQLIRVNHDVGSDDDDSSSYIHRTRRSSAAPEETRDSAHATNKQQQPIGLQQLSLTTSHVGSVQYLTRDTHTSSVAILGRSA